MRSPDLITELTATPGRFALIAGAPHDVIVECERLLEVSCCHVGALLADRGSPPSDTEVESTLRPHPLLVEIESCSLRSSHSISSPFYDGSPVTAPRAWQPGPVRSRTGGRSSPSRRDRTITTGQSMMF